MNYFEFYGLPVSFFLDEKALKNQYLRKSKEYHPDFHTLASTEERDRVLDMSAFNNVAYRTLSNIEKRIAYILELKGVLIPGAKSEVPQDFLIEMMDINERLMEFEMDGGSNELREKLLAEIGTIEATIQADITEAMAAHDRDEAKETSLQRVKNSYLKSKYVSRIKAQVGQ